MAQESLDTLFGEARSRLQHSATGDGWRALMRVLAQAWALDAPRVIRAWVPYLKEHLASWPDTLRTLHTDSPLAAVAGKPGAEALAPLMRRLIVRGDEDAEQWMHPVWTRPLTSLELEQVRWVPAHAGALGAAARLRRLSLRELDGVDGALDALQSHSLQELTHLAWPATTLEPEQVARMVDLELPSLVELDFREQRTIGVEHLKALRDGPLLASLERLVLRGAWLGSDALSALEDAPWLEDLEVDTTGYTLSFQINIQLT